MAALAHGTRKHLPEWFALGLILAAHLVNSLTWSVAVPLWQGTDEAAHFGLIQYIAETGRLPEREHRYRSEEIMLSSEFSDVSRLPWDATQRQAFAPGDVGLREHKIEALDPALRTSFERRAVNQVMLVPPLYGAIGAIFYRLRYDASVIERAFAVRVYSILISAIALAFVYLLAREVWPEQSNLWLTLTLLVAFQPQFTYSAAGGTSDVLAMLWFTVLTYLMVRALRWGIDYPLAVWMGISLGLGLLTKPYLFLTGPALISLFAYLWWRHRADRSKTVRCALIVVAIGLVLWSWWAVRCYRLNGNLFYDNPWTSGRVSVENPQHDYPLGRYLRDHLVSLWGGLFASYWGVFGYLDTPVAPAYYRALQVLTLVSVVGFGWYVWKSQRACALTAEYTALALLIVQAVSPIVYLSYLNYSMWQRMGIGWPLMGRHFAGPVAAQMALWMWGLVAWVPKRARWGWHLLLRTGIVTANYLCLFGYVLPRYYL